MSFKEFDMSEYFNALEEFMKEHEDRIIKAFGSIDKYNEHIKEFKSKEDEIAKNAIKQYGSVGKFVEAIKYNWNNSKMFNLADLFDEFKNDFLEDKHPVLSELFKKLTRDLTKDPSSKEIQQIAEEITTIAKKDYEIFQMENGDDHWYTIVQLYLVFPEWIEKVDKKYSTGASKFIGETLKIYLGDKKPKMNSLFEMLTSDLGKDPSSKDIQAIILEIVKETEKQYEAAKIAQGENYWSYMSENYLSNNIWIKANDKKYGEGASKFIGEAIKFYSENNT